MGETRVKLCALAASGDLNVGDSGRRVKGLGARCFGFGVAV